MEMFFDFIGKRLFSRQQPWEQRRNAKTMTAAVLLGLLLGLAIFWAIRYMNSRK